jgi:hypothetical protein
MKAGAIFREFLLENSFFLRNQVLLGLIMGGLLPVCIALYMLNIKMMTLSVLYLCIHLLIEDRVYKIIREDFSKKHPKEAELLSK